VTNPELAASFEFAKRLRDAKLRKLIEAMGGSGQDVVVCLDSTTVAEVFDRVFTRCRPPALVAIRRPPAPHGFVFMMVHPAAQPADASAGPELADPIGEDASIGMLYDTLIATAGMSFRMGPGRSYNLQSVGPELVGA
jgi:hypothetical protein